MPIRKARKPYQCTERNYHTIQPGALYLYAACPPWSDGSRTGKKWDVIRACLCCAREFGMMNSDDREELERKEHGS